MSGPDGDDPRNVLSYIAARLADESDDEALAEVVDLDEYRRIRARREAEQARADASKVTAMRSEFDDDLDPVS